MTDIERLLAEQSCVSLIMRYAQAVNQRDIDGFVTLFETDAVWQRPGELPLIGHAAIRQFMDNRRNDRVLRHVNGGYVVSVESDNTASGISQTTVYEVFATQTLPAAMNGPRLVVEYRDRFNKSANGWRIARRDTLVVFRNQT